MTDDGHREGWMSNQGSNKGEDAASDDFKDNEGIDEIDKDNSCYGCY